MLTEDLPIDVFINTKFSDRDISTITDNWRVENDTLISIISSYFKDLGIYRAKPTFEDYLKKQVIFLLHNAPEIVELVKKAEANELLRHQSKHADI